MDDSDKMKIIDTLSSSSKANQRWAEGKMKKMNTEDKKEENSMKNGMTTIPMI